MLTKTELMEKNWPKIPEVELQDASGNFVRLTESRNNIDIDRDWIFQELHHAVRLGTGAEDIHREYPEKHEFPMVSIDNYASLIVPIHDPVEASVQLYERLVNEKGLLSDGFGTSEKIMTILLSSEFRSGSLSLLSPAFINRLHTWIRDMIDRLRPIEIVLPTLPFKDQNPLTTGHSVDAVDLGEYLFLSRIGRLGKSIERIYPRGFHAHIVADGSVYSDIFLDGETAGPFAYFNTCKSILEEIGVSSYVDMTNLEDLIVLEKHFYPVRENIAAFLKEDTFRPILLSLERGILFNLQMPDEWNSYTEFVNIARRTKSELQSEYPIIAHKMEHAAIQYASFLLSMKKMNILQRAFPLAIRATVHPKQNQLGIRMIGDSRVAPYNGVCVVDAGSVSIRRLWELYERNDIDAVYRQTDREPFFYVVNMLK